MYFFYGSACIAFLVSNCNMIRNICQYCRHVLKRKHLIPVYCGWTFQFLKNMVTFPPHMVTFPWYFYKTTSRIKTTKIAWVLLFLPRWSKSKVAPSIIDASICLYDFQNRILCDMQNTFSFFSRPLQFLNISLASNIFEFTNTMANTVQCHFTSFLIGPFR